MLGCKLNLFGAEASFEIKELMMATKKMPVGKAFLLDILELIQPQYPKIWSRCVGKQGDDLVENYVFSEIEMKLKNPGRRIGRVNKYLRLLFILGGILYNEGFATFERRRLVVGSISNGREALEAAGGNIQFTIGKLCIAAFWEFVMLRFNLHPEHGEAFILNTDWSISVVVQSGADLGTQVTDVISRLKHLAQVQITAASLVSYAVPWL